VPNISKDNREELATKTIELFNNIINVMQRYKILDGLGNGIYDELHKLRRYRNKVYIQTDVDINGVSGDENVAFFERYRDLGAGIRRACVAASE
jgi:hypothetical protein